MKKKTEKKIPYFCWDRELTEQQIKDQLKRKEGPERDNLIAWILREAAFKDVWRFLTPKEVANCLPRIQYSLGRWKDFWNYITKTWHELGKI
ncbi:MAG: hypothetical protein PVH61_37515 [Candidatus Aminicenantes bacterium]|jgi:hypothetical protein